MKVLFLALAGFCLLSLDTQAQKKIKKSAAVAAPELEKGSLTTDGQRTGKWNFYNKKQQLELTFDYDSARISFLQPDTAHYLVRIGEQWQPHRVNRAPHLLGSTEQWLMTLNQKLRYPASALRQQLQGTVLVAYTVNPDGHTSDYAIESSLSADCDQEVWRVLKELPDNWIPAIYQGRPAATRFYLAVQFKIMDQAGFQRQQREQERRSQVEPAAVAPLVTTKPSYLQQVEVVAVGIERNSRNEIIGRQPR